MKQTDPQYKLRMPPALKDKIEAAARENNRSINAEMVSRLESTFEDDSSLVDLWSKVELLEYKLESQQEQIRSLAGKFGPADRDD